MKNTQGKKASDQAWRWFYTLHLPSLVLYFKGYRQKGIIYEKGKTATLQSINCSQSD